jgi:transposase
MSELAVALTEPTRPLRSRAATRTAWEQRLARFAHSGLSPASFCATEGVSLPSFYSWKRRLATQACGATEPAPGEDRSSRLLPVRVLPQSAAVEVVLPCGAVLRVLPSCDLPFVRSLVQVLGGAPC